MKEFSATQLRLSKEKGEDNRFNIPLKPFIKKLVMPLMTSETDSTEKTEAEKSETTTEADADKTANNGDNANDKATDNDDKDDDSKYMTSLDTFDTRSLGYVYDELPERRPPQMRVAPTYVLFKDINPSQLNNKSYQIHIFLSSSSSSSTSPTEGGDEAVNKDGSKLFQDNIMSKVDICAWSEMSEYAGNCGVFGGKADETCANCAKSGTVYVKLEVSSTLQKLSLSRHQAKIFCVCVDEVTEREDIACTPLIQIHPSPFFLANLCFCVYIEIYPQRNVLVG